MHQFVFVALLKVQRSLLQNLAEIGANVDLMNTPPHHNGKPSNIEKLVLSCCAHLGNCSDLKNLNDRMYMLAEVVSEHKHTYESAMATTLSKLVNDFVKITLEKEEGRRVACARPKGVIKKTLKATIQKPVEVPSNIYAGHIKQFVVNANKMLRKQQLIDAAFPPHLIDETVGEIIDPVVGGGAADPNIWGPVV
jgi:hypothetical protein